MTARRPPAAQAVEVFELDAQGRGNPGASGDPDGLAGNGRADPGVSGNQTDHTSQNDHGTQLGEGSHDADGNHDDRGAYQDMVDVVGEGTGPDVIDQGRKRTSLLLTTAARWRRSAVLQRALVGAAIVVGVAGLAVAGVAIHGALTAKPGNQYFVDERLVPPDAVSVNVLGCPHAVSCAVEAAPAPLVTLARRLSGPGAQVTSALQTVDGASHRVYRREIDLAADRLLVRVVAQCVPGAGPVSAQPVLTHDTSQSPLQRGERATALIPGAAGCSLYVEAAIVTGPRTAPKPPTKLVAALAARNELLVAP